MGEEARFIQKYPPIKQRHPRARPERNEAIVRALLVDELTMPQVAEMFSISKQRVQQIADCAGLRVRYSKGQSKKRIMQEQAAQRRLAQLEHYEEGLRLVRSGVSVPQAAARIKLHYSTLLKQARAAGMISPTARRTFVSKETKLEAERRLIEGWDETVISWELGIGYPAIVRIRTKLKAQGKLPVAKAEPYVPKTEAEKAARELGLILDGQIEEWQQWREETK